MTALRQAYPDIYDEVGSFTQRKADFGRAYMFLRRMRHFLHISNDLGLHYSIDPSSHTSIPLIVPDTTQTPVLMKVTTYNIVQSLGLKVSHPRSLINDISDFQRPFRILKHIEMGDDYDLSDDEERTKKEGQRLRLKTCLHVLVERDPHTVAAVQGMSSTERSSLGWSLSTLKNKCSTYLTSLQPNGQTELLLRMPQINLDTF